uniref:Uncharacterized protein n=1 Tax=Caulobacter phage BL57 TaxID=3348355 RepID=A0AB74UGW5_9VIRU
MRPSSWIVPAVFGLLAAIPFLFLANCYGTFERSGWLAAMEALRARGYAKLSVHAAHPTTIDDPTGCYTFSGQDGYNTVHGRICIRRDAQGNPSSKVALDG